MIQNATHINHRNAKQERINKIQNLAKGFESQFASELLKKMDQTVGRTGEESSAAKIYKSMLQDEYAKIISNQPSGLGIKQMIERDLYRRNGISNPIAKYQVPKHHNEKKSDISMPTTHDISKKNNPISMGHPFRNVGMNTKEPSND